MTGAFGPFRSPVAGHYGALTAPNDPFQFPPGAEIATPALWPGTDKVDTYLAGLVQYGPARGTRIALGAGQSHVWMRAVHEPPVQLQPGADYACSVWYHPGSSGRIRLEAHGSSGADHLSIAGRAGELAVNRQENFTVTNLTNGPIQGGGYVVSFTATMSVNASSTPSLGIGPDTSVAGEDVILLAVELTQIS